MQKKKKKKKINCNEKSTESSPYPSSNQLWHFLLPTFSLVAITFKTVSLTLFRLCLSFVGILKYYEKFIFQMWMLDLMPCIIINDNLEGTQAWFGGESTTSLWKLDTS